MCAVDEFRALAASYLRSMRGVLCGLALLIPFGAQAQEHPYIQEYVLQEQDGGIYVSWTIEGGSTCDGLEVQRSLDSLQFTTIHRIDGICGDPAVPRHYDLFDTDPPELTRAFYRIMLGFDGYSSVKAIRYSGLIRSDQRFFPNPVSDLAVLVLNLPRAGRVDLEIFDVHGCLVYARAGESGPQFTMDLGALPSGTYTYVASGEFKQFIGRFVKA